MAGAKRQNWRGPELWGRQCGDAISSQLLVARGQSADRGIRTAVEVSGDRVGNFIEGKLWHWPPNLHSLSFGDS